jgi:tyrosinase
MNMSHLTRRQFLRTGGLAAAALGLRPWPVTTASARAVVLTRYSIQSGPGKEMLAILAGAVTKMRAAAEGDPRSWVFQWYTHLVKGSDENLDANKQNELDRIYQDATDSNRKIAEAMWNTCEPHMNDTMGDFFLPWHRMYLFYFEQIVRAVTGEAHFTLPYWDYTDPGQRSLPVEFRRPRDPVWGPLFFGHRWPRINAGKPIDEPPTAGPVTLTALKMGLYRDCATEGGVVAGFCSSVMSDPHRLVHLSVGDRQGMMSFPYTANDPVFWVHHCNVDRLWASWNKAGGKNPADEAYTKKTYTFVDGTGKVPEQQPAVGAFLDTTALGYAYDAYVPRPDDSTPFTDCDELTFTPLAASAEGAGRIKLRPSVLTLRLAPAGSSGAARPGSFAARLRDIKLPGELHLVLEDLAAGGDPRAVFEVYLTGRARGRHSRNHPTFLGAIEFLETGHQHAGHGRPRKGRSHSFVVGPALRKLLAEPGVDAPRVTLVPAGPFAARSAPTVGRIVLGTLGKKP